MNTYLKKNKRQIEIQLHIIVKKVSVDSLDKNRNRDIENRYKINKEYLIKKEISKHKIVIVIVWVE